MKRYWKQLLPAYLFSWPVFFSTYLWALLVHFADSINNDSGNLLKRMLIITTLHVSIFGAMYIIKLTLLDRVKPAVVPLLLLTSLMAVSVFRGYLMEQWLFNWEIIKTLDLGLRMRTSLLNSSSSIAIAVIAAANTRHHHITRARLLNESERLENIKSQSLEAIDSYENEVLNSLKSELSSHFEAIQGKPLSEILMALKNIIDKVVQPLSRRLEIEYKPWTPPAPKSIEIKVDWFQVFKSSLKVPNVNYILVPTVMVIVAIPTVIEQISVVQGLIGLGFSMLIGVSIGLISKRIFRGSNFHSLKFLLVTTLSGLSMGVASLPMSQSFEAPYGLLILSTIFYPITASIFSLLTGADKQLIDSSKALEKTTADLEWNVARVREIQHRNQRSLARSLHGTLQAKLASAYLQLENRGAEEQSSMEINQIIEKLREYVTNLEVTATPAEELSVVLEKIKDNWVAISNIKHEVDPMVFQLIQSDPFCSTALVDVIPELIFNSIKHGKAQEIEVAISIPEDHILHLEVIDNGAYELIENRIGLGTRILDESSLNWSRRRDGDRTITTANFAFSRE